MLTAQENYGRTKETHAHTQTLWEKEIRRARKDTFKSQSIIVKLQEELKAVRSTLRKSQSDVDDEKERSNMREQEAFEARYQLVGLQEELTGVMEKIKLVEQERDALRTIAKNEEVARIAAEGRIPLPKLNENDEFASPRKASAPLRRISIMSSLSSEEEIGSLKQALEWERQRVGRAYDQVEHMQLECQFKCCSCKILERTGNAIFALSPKVSLSTAPGGSEEKPTISGEPTASYLLEDSNPEARELSQPRAIFIPSEGIFRTISPPIQESSWNSPAKQSPPTRDEPLINFPQSPPRPSFYARTPSCEPPSMALFQENTSLLSLLDAPPSPTGSEGTVIHYQNHNRMGEREENTTLAHHFLTAAHPVAPFQAPNRRSSHQRRQSTDRVSTTHNFPQLQDNASNLIVEAPSQTPAPPSHTHREQPGPTFHTVSTTTRVPLAMPSDYESTPNLTANTTALTGLPASLDPALSPTMTREEALAMIRERRGRARSLHQAQVSSLMTPKKGRDVSAPANSGMTTAPRSARSVSRGRLNRA